MTLHSLFTELTDIAGWLDGLTESQLTSIENLSDALRRYQKDKEGALSDDEIKVGDLYWIADKPYVWKVSTGDQCIECEVNDADCIDVPCDGTKFHLEEVKLIANPYMAYQSHGIFEYEKELYVWQQDDSPCDKCSFFGRDCKSFNEYFCCYLLKGYYPKKFVNNGK